jgi:peptide deformylase
VTVDLSKKEEAHEPRVSSIRKSPGRPKRKQPTGRAACRSRKFAKRSSGRCRSRSNLDGKAHEIEADRLFSRCLQHEVDHINGVLFIDHISKLKRDRVIKKFSKAAKKKVEA